MVAATSTVASNADDEGCAGRSVTGVSDESSVGACGDDDAAVAFGSWLVAGGGAAMASCAGLHRRPSYTCTPFPYRRHYAVRRKNGVLLPR
jgi:hypothetical protein